MDALTATHANGLDAMQRAARCEHVKLNGQRCNAPAMKSQRWCLFHRADYEGAFPATGVPEDAATIQIELARVIRQLQDKQLDARSAGLIIYALQTASMNLKRLGVEMPAEPAVEGEELVASLYRQLDPLPERAVAAWCDLANLVRRSREPYDPANDDLDKPASTPRSDAPKG